MAWFSETRVASARICSGKIPGVSVGEFVEASGDSERARFDP